ncbi:MAG: hypothetical protein HOP29_07980 [Phycisphaerales bacterium]|nr:hypothetical protein [Phycisphaerales bacterium]
MSGADRETDGGDRDGHPRAFVTATGFVFQAAGGVHVAMGVVYLLASGLYGGDSGTRAVATGDAAEPLKISATVTTVGTLAVLAGGMALAALGVGMQGERPGSARWGMVASGLLAGIGLGSAVLFAMPGSAWGRAILAIGHGCANGVLFLLAGHSRSILKEFPPPADQNVVDDAWLEAHAQRRRGHG